MSFTSKKKILALIPAREDSKGIPRKNTVQLKGRPLIVYSIQSAGQSRLIDKTVVATDSEEIAKVAK
ncbi:MAG: acylneuraminate cytidylyltransferase family protein, partial [Candidatus Colwellbacteria bacterium]|nr:acylneuraminate cytidylyltransferase family protein [Candidatus Colwellbacteria bacterium]